MTRLPPTWFLFRYRPGRRRSRPYDWAVDG